MPCAKPPYTSSQTPGLAFRRAQQRNPLRCCSKRPRISATLEQSPTPHSSVPFAPPRNMLRLGSHHQRTESPMKPVSPWDSGGSGSGVGADLLMDLTNSAAEGWRMRSRKSCQASGAVEDPKASPPPSIVAGSEGCPGTGS